MPKNSAAIRATKQILIVLGIETSCDDTAIGIIADGKLLAHSRQSQLDILKLYGGVVPELAARDHINKLIPLIDAVVAKAGIEPAQLTAVAVTTGPGLVSALKTGVAVAEGIATGLNIPLIGINHLEGHLLSPLLGIENVEFPWTSLLISGGHSMLVSCTGLGKYKILGMSLDDAAGECFDKVARMLGLGFPGGPAIEEYAKQATSTTHYNLPRPMLKKNNLDFSFSGLKTAVLYALRKEQQKLPKLLAEQKREDYWPNEIRANISAELQQVITDVFVEKVRRALDVTQHKSFMLVGGVAANQTIGASLQTLCDSKNVNFYTAPLQFCSDNGAMIALTGYLRLLNMGNLRNPDNQNSQIINNVQVNQRWSIESLSVPVWLP